MKITIELLHDFGHYNNNRPTSDTLIKAVMKEIGPVFEKEKNQLFCWSISGVKVEGR